MGEHQVKNIVKPVKVYKVPMGPGVTVAEEKVKKPLTAFWRRKVFLASAFVVLAIIIGVGVWNFYLRPPPIEPASVERRSLKHVRGRSLFIPEIFGRTFIWQPLTAC